MSRPTWPRLRWRSAASFSYPDTAQPFVRARGVGLLADQRQCRFWAFDLDTAARAAIIREFLQLAVRSRRPLNEFRKVERMLPMRRLLCILIVGLSLGCSSQSSQLTNPFMAPNRVPPPATRTLLPGTAQPFYPGDPVPNSPAVGIPAAVTPPATTFGPAPTFAPGQSTPTAPPGGWNTYPSSGPMSAAPPSPWSGSSLQASAQAPIGSVAEETVQVPMDVADAQFGATTQSQVSLASYEAPLDPATAQQFAGTINPVSPTLAQQDVTIREISSANLPEAHGITGQSAVRTGRDGFRAQGSSQLRDEARDVPALAQSNNSILPTPEQEPAASYGFDPEYRWLRGHLAYTPTTGQWYVQYVAPGMPADSFGGTVPIANPQVLGPLQPGELVAVEGRVEMLQLDATSVTPAYTITVLQRQQQAVR